MESLTDYEFEGDYDVTVTCLSYEVNESLICNGTTYVLPEKPLNYQDGLFWVYIFLYIFLMLMSGVFSGLVLGLVSLDLTILKVLKAAGPPTVQKYATKISPLVENHHLLLVTLLLANAIAMEALPLCLDRVSDPLTAILVSVTTVLFFGEVIPQAVCARYGLAIGSALIPLVYFLIGIFFVVAFPIAKLLDFILGRGHGTYYRRAELKALVNLHGKSHNDLPHHHHQDVLSGDEIMIIQGALDMKDKTASHAMIVLNDVFMLSFDTCLNDDVMSQIQKTFYSRIPVYDHCRGNIQGILMVKSLIRLNPKDAKSIRQLMGTKAILKPHFVPEDMSLFDLLNHFQTGKNHVAVVVKRDNYRIDHCTEFPKRESVSRIDEICNCLNTSVIGVVTLEGIIEELLQKKIHKESDHLQGSLNSVLHYALSKLSLRQVPSSPSLAFMQGSVAEEREVLSPALSISFNDSSSSYSKVRF